MGHKAELHAEAAGHETRHASDFAGIDEDDVLAGLTADEPDGDGDGPAAAAAPARAADGKFTSGNPKPKPKPAATEKTDHRQALTKSDADEDAALDRLDAEYELTDDDGNPIGKTKNDPGEEPETGEDPELQAARDELRRVHGLEDEDLKGLTPDQVRRRLTRERKAQDDIKALRTKLSAAGRGTKQDPDDGGSDPDDSAGAPETSRRTEPDDLDDLIKPFEDSLTEEFADGEVAKKASDALRGAVRRVHDAADERIKAIGANHDALVAEVHADRLERAYGRTFDEGTRAKLAEEAKLQAAVILARRGKQDGPMDGRALQRESFDRAGREVLGDVPPASRSETAARANGSPAPTGRRPSTDTSERQRAKRMSEDEYLESTLERLETGDREGVERLTRARRS